MNARSFDWKDVANAQFEKALALAIVLVLFGIMLSPRIEVAKPTQVYTDIQVVPLQPDVKDKMVQPPVVVPRPDVIIDEMSTTSDADRQLVDDALRSLGGTIDKPIPPRAIKVTAPPIFVPFEDEPEVISMVRPEYPKFARQFGIEGIVVLDVEVYKDGTVGNITVFKSLSKGANGLDQAAIDAVKQWKFQPGKSGGKPVNTIVRIPLEFSLTEN